MKATCRIILTIVAVLVLTQADPAAGTPANGQFLRTKIPGPSLEGNLLGFPSERDAVVYLPPSYETDTDRRYPVLYLLHGIGDGTGPWESPWADVEPGYATVRDVMDRGVAEGTLHEMIIVIPDARTPFFGCFYANSPVKGDWEQFVAEDMVAWADTKFRTIASPDGRGLLGHSMGGHGAIRMGMKRPDVFSAVYGMNSAVLDWAGDVSAENPAFGEVYEVTRPEDLQGRSLYVVAAIGISQAFSPAPDKSPFLADYPFKVQNGALVPNEPAHSLWEENMPVHMASRFAENLKKLRGLRFDSAFTDEYSHIPPSNRALSEELTRLGVKHSFEMYNGDHRNRLWGMQGRIRTEALPWFSDLLAQQAAGH